MKIGREGLLSYKIHSCVFNPNTVGSDAYESSISLCSERNCWIELFRSSKESGHFPTEGPRREELSGCNHENTSTWGCKTRLQPILEAVVDRSKPTAMKLSPAILDWR